MSVQRKMIPVVDETENQHVSAFTDNDKEYGKLTLVFVGIFLVSIVLFLAIDGNGPFEDLTPAQSFASQFMGVFFLVFAGFKLVNLSSFVHGFAMYDLIAKKSVLYAKSYPFIQLAIGILMFAFPSFALTHALAFVVSGLALLGVIVSLSRKQKIKCACLGNVIKMPLATVSAIEDGSMFVISLIMLFAMIG